VAHDRDVLGRQELHHRQTARAEHRIGAVGQRPDCGTQDLLALHSLGKAQGGGDEDTRRATPYGGDIRCAANHHLDPGSLGSLCFPRGVHGHLGVAGRMSLASPEACDRHEALRGSGTPVEQTLGHLPSFRA
jgi:hypothetical protein